MLEEPNCSKRRCKHLTGVKQASGTEEDEVCVCKAFPDGIPFDIAYGNNLHLKPVTGDHGIQFEKEAD